MINIIPFSQEHCESIHSIYKNIIEQGDAFYTEEIISRSKFLETWLQDDSFIAELNGEAIGAYSLFPIAHGRRSHIACAVLMVSPNFRGKGIGKLLAKHSVKRAKERGFIAMQFDCVAGTNKPAIGLWTKLGFRIIGTVPGGFRHLQHGFIDSYIMFKGL